MCKQAQEVPVVGEPARCAARSDRAMFTHVWAGTCPPKLYPLCMGCIVILKLSFGGTKCSVQLSLQIVHAAFFILCPNLEIQQ